MAKTLIQAEVVDKAAPEPSIQKKRATPEKNGGPFLAAGTTASALPPPNGTPPFARAADLMLAPDNGTGAAGRARIMRAMQGTVGNACLSRMLDLTVQAKLTVGAPNDKYEQEADRVADTVMRMAEPPIPTEEAAAKPTKGASAQRIYPQRKEEPSQTSEAPARIVGSTPPYALRLQSEEERRGETAQAHEVSIQKATVSRKEVLRRQPRKEGEQEPVQAQERSGGAPEVTPELERQLNARRGSGQPLPESTRSSMGLRFGRDFNQVRVHADSQAANAAQELNARAFTSQQDVYFGAGQYQPGSVQGQRLLAHELAHVVQQSPVGAQVDTAALSQAPALATTGMLQRDDKEGEKDVLPTPVHVVWGGDPFTISFERKTERLTPYFVFVVRYTGKFPVDGPGLRAGVLRMGVPIAPAKLKASVMRVPGRQVAVDLYGYRDRIVKLVDDVELDPRPGLGRRHDLVSKSMGEGRQSSSLWVKDPEARPIEKTPAEPSPSPFSAAKQPVFVGGIASVDIILGPYHDHFRITVQTLATTLQPTPPTKAIFGITPLYRGKPVNGLGAEFMVYKPPVVRVLKAGGGSVSLDISGNDQTDLLIEDEIREPERYDGGGPIEKNRNHTVRVSGRQFGNKTFAFKVRYGAFIRGSPGTATDRAATSNALAVTGLSQHKGKLGTFEEQLDGYEIAMMDIRRKAADDHLITKKTYDAWAKLSQAMIQLRPQVEKNREDPEKFKVDASLVWKAALSARELYDSLTSETSRRTEPLPNFEGAAAATFVNPYTGESTTSTIIKTFTFYGPARDVPVSLLLRRWDEAYANYNVLVRGLDRWIIDRIKEVKGAESEEAQQAVAWQKQREALGSIEKYKPIRVVAVFHPDRKFANEPGYVPEIPLALYAWKENDSWRLRDLTNPDKPYDFPSSASSTGEEPPVRLFDELDDPDHFPVGVVHFEIPGKYGGQVKTTDYLTWREFFSYLGLGLALVGLTLVSFGGSVAVVGGWALAGSAVAGGIAAGIDIGEGIKHGDMTTTRMIVDIGQIVAALAGVSALRSGTIVRRAMTAAEEGAPLVGRAAEYAVFMRKVYVVSGGSRIGADVLTVAAFSVDVARQLDEIENSPGSRSERDRAKALLLAQLAVTGGLTALSIKGDLPQLGSGRKLILHFPHEGGPPVATVGGKPVPSRIKFSQKDVGYLTGDKTMTIDELAKSMKTGWKGPPIDVVEYPDGSMTSLDNRRLLAAQNAGLKEIPVAYHHPNEPFPPARAAAKEFKLRYNVRRLEDGSLVVGGKKGEIVFAKGFRPTTFGEAVTVRTANQGTTQPGEKFPIGGRYEQPKIRYPKTGAPGADR